MTGVRVVLDGRPLQAGFKAHRQRGIGRYAKNLVESFLSLDQPPQVEFLLQKDLPDPGLVPDASRFLAETASAWLPAGKRLLTYHFLIRRPLLPAWRENKIVHFLSHLDAPARVGPGTVITVHDLIFQRMHKSYRAGRSRLEFALKRWLETRSLFQAEKLIAVSDQTKDDLIDIFGISPQRIEVIPEAADPALGPEKEPARVKEVLSRQSLPDRGKFFLYLGGIDTRKGMTVLLEALAHLRGQGLTHSLALAGAIENDPQYPRLLQDIQRLNLQNEVRLLGYVPDEDLPSLFSACLAFVFPSLYEGFGLPPLEAMACGAPVVAADTPAVREVVQNAGLLVTPGKTEELAGAMASLTTNPDLADDCRARGFKQAARFSWLNTARRTMAVYQEVAGA
ncbi:MAG: glycosyltransferase family 1 protein [Desulfarculaceae bacterium]|jgi:glycosyltransferase involved in cell wall biosynthesis